MPSRTSPKSSFVTARQKEREQPKIRGKNARKPNERDKTILEAVKVLHNMTTPDYDAIGQLFERMRADKVCFIEYWPHLKARLDDDMASETSENRGRGPEWQLALALAKRYRFAPMITQLTRLYVSRPWGEQEFQTELAVIFDLETHV